MDLTETTQWQALQTHYMNLRNVHLRELFQNDPDRFNKFSLEAAGLFLDYSKNRITQETLTLLFELAESRQLSTNIQTLLNGKFINAAENRPVLHTVLRDFSDEPLYLDGIDLHQQLTTFLKKMQHCVEDIRSGKWAGYTQKPFTDIVHIGIGGSHLGPLMATEALDSFYENSTHLRCHFISSADSTQINHVLKPLNPETTLFIFASKTFTTTETLINADRAKAWLTASAKSSQGLERHFIATTTHTQNALDYGIADSCIFPMWEGVGGRYSLWSTMGLPIALLIGMENFKALLSGAHAMDEHFKNAPFTENLPVVLGLLGIWYNNFFQAETHTVLPYSYRLRSLSRYLQQLDMESNGKHATTDGSDTHCATAPILFGDTGTESQHSFHQLLFQGTHLIPCDFVAVLKHPNTEQDQPFLLANCFAQSQALMWGKSVQEATAVLQEQNVNNTQKISELARQKAIPGNQPSNTIVMPELTPYTLGALIALYEHKTFVQGIIWNINSFDQWGVELGKVIAKNVLKSLQHPDKTTQYDSSTTGLIAYYQKA